MLVTMRDQGIPLPAGAILISPWVDLTHSFPSVGENNPLDYIPPHGFHQRPSAAWPPPNADDMLAIEEGIVKKMASRGQASHPQEREADAIQGFHVDSHPETGTQNANGNTNGGTRDATPVSNPTPGTGANLSIMLDGKLVEIKDQIQMYASNQLISHPLVSPILQPSLGGLPPLLILTGGGEMLRDEQIYLAHKAADPTKYPPGNAFLDEVPNDHLRDQVNKWKPTDVQLQVWEDLCHVAPTLSFTRPAKHMYRSIAQFGAWALARAQKTEIEILDDDDVSVISRSDSERGGDVTAEKVRVDTGVLGKNVLTSFQKKASQKKSAGHIGKAGDPLPPFKNHMIRQRVDRHGNIYNLEPASELPGCNLAPSEIGVIKEGPVRKWMAAKREWDIKFASSKRKVQKQRAKEIAQGYQQFDGGEVPPPSALASRIKTGVDLKEAKNKKSWGMSLWALWGSKHDEKTIGLEQEADKEPETTVASATDGAGARPLHDTKTTEGKKLDIKKDATSRSRSRRRTVTDQNQTGNASDVDEDTPASELLAMKKTRMGETGSNPLAPSFTSKDNEMYANMPTITIKTPTNEESELKRPKAGGIAFPFSLKSHGATASMTTLTSSVGVPPADDVRTPSAMESGVKHNVADITATNAAGKNVEEAKLNGPSCETERPPESPLATPTGVNVVENGEVVSATRPPLETFVTAVSATRPPLETFVTAASNLPTSSAK
jgi:acetyl esterase/lipase